ncbi:hypothetical protein A7K91_01195 [Paenibacillus oryzae]|uniref:Uncharacterized protein n=1 Tax=Paenibacillus oryzae TaxID=1844972 RepID=A0A1A5Y9H3_9BACL|nr:hypothetical protein A7K91_01195 [Paenibacillus oryzae]
MAGYQFVKDIGVRKPQKLCSYTPFWSTKGQTWPLFEENPAISSSNGHQRPANISEYKKSASQRRKRAIGPYSILKLRF